MPTHTSTTPSEKSFEATSSLERDVAEHWKRRRSESVLQFAGLISGADVLDDIRGKLKKDELSGKDTWSDLFRATIKINGLDCKERGKQIFDASAEDMREAKFPRDRLCAYMGMTEQQYRKIDTYSKRRDIFFVLNSLFENATSAASAPSQLQIPHMLLIEELATTLHQGGITGFPLIQILQSGHKEDEYVNDKPRIDNSVQDRKEITLYCDDPNKISVVARCWTPKWLGGGVMTSLQYYMSFLPGKGSRPDSILYDKVELFVTFPSAVAGHTGPPSEEDLARSINSSITASELEHKNLDNFTYPETGLTVHAGFERKALTARSMLLPTPEKTRFSTFENLQTTEHAADTIIEPTLDTTDTAPGERQPSIQPPATDAESTTEDLHLCPTPDTEAQPSQSHSSDDYEQSDLPKTDHDTTAAMEDEAHDTYGESVENGEEQTNKLTIGTKIREFFSKIGRGIQRFLEAIKNLFCRCTGDSGAHDEQYNKMYEHISGKMPDDALDLDVQKEHSSEASIEHAEASKSEHVDGNVPNSSTSSVDVRPVGGSSSRSRAG